MPDTLLYNISFIVFLIIYGLLIIFLIIQYRQTQKLARPFIFSLILYFIFDSLARVVLTFMYYIYEMEEYDALTADPTAALLMLLWVIFLIFGPIYLIFILEKTIVNKSILKDKHIFTIVQIILFITGILIIFSRQDPIITPQGLTLGTAFILLVIILQVMFFLTGFLYLSVKSTGEYRRNSLLIFFGYLGQFIVNAISLISVQGNPTLTVDEKFNLAGIFLLLRVIQ